MPDPAHYLPVELLHKIIYLATLLRDPRHEEIVHHWALIRVYLPLSLVNHFWGDFVRPYIYTKVDLTNPKFMGFLAACRRPETRDLVRYLKAPYTDQIGSAMITTLVLRLCPNLETLEMYSTKRPTEWPTDVELSAVQEAPSLAHLQLCRFRLPDFYAPLAHLRELELVLCRIPLTLAGSPHLLPSVDTLSIVSDDYLVEEHAEDPELPTRQFIIALTPQLHTLRIDNGDRGIPVDLVQLLVVIGLRLRSLEVTEIWEVEPTAIPCTRPLLPPSLPPLSLSMRISSRDLRYYCFREETRDDERLWRSFASWADPALDAVREARKVECVHLEYYLPVYLPGGEEKIRERLGNKGIDLVFDRFHSFFPPTMMMMGFP